MNHFLRGLALASLFWSQSVLAQDSHGKHYYVVIGAFTYEKNATDFMDWCRKLGLTPSYQMNKNRNLFYVWTMRENHWGVPVREAERLRNFHRKLDKTWVFYGTLDDIPGAPPIAEEKPKMEPQKVVELANDTAAVIQSGEPAAQAQVAEPTEGFKIFYFNLLAEDGTQLKSAVELVDLDASKLGALYQSHEAVEVKPINKSGRMMAQAKVFGYRLQQFNFNYNNPTDSTEIAFADGRYMVPLVLKPLKEGDIAIMYNVFFFKDAGIMRPDSKYEVNELLKMMKDFPERKITIHGHTNGNWRGKILTMNEEKNYFSVVDAKESRGSAIELSKARAMCIVEYLISNGIDRSRMEVKAWGGKKMLFESDHAKALDNVRVEVEIVKE